MVGACIIEDCVVVASNGGMVEDWSIVKSWTAEEEIAGNGS